ncbi:MAG: anion transporter [Deltaproteobacteria bacterium]|nr:anion transporter [Deltaproteobacteria bacterium]
MAGQRLPFIPVDRPAAALCGAVAMVVFGGLSLEEAYRAINLDTIGLLLGVMIIAAYLMEAKFFRYTAWWVLTRARSSRSLLWALVFVAGGLSALLVNDTICLMFTPLVLAVASEARLPALPYLLALATASNLGGAVTFTGNPQNMIIGMAAAGNPGYLEYLLLSLPAGVLCLAVDAALLSWMFRKVLPRGKLAEHAPPRPELDRVLAGKGLLALALFVGLAMSGRSLAGAAMVAAALLLAVARVEPRRAFHRVDWVLLLFFAGLFVVIRGVERSGALSKLTEPLLPYIGVANATGYLAFALITVVGSNLVSNVPFVLVAAKWVPHMPEPRWGFIVLAFASTLAGNLTLFGSVANLIVFESAEASSSSGHGPRIKVGFFEFLRYGSVLSLATLAVALAVLFWEQKMGW